MKEEDIQKQISQMFSGFKQESKKCIHESMLRMNDNHISMLELDNEDGKKKWESVKIDYLKDKKLKDLLRENIKLKEEIETLKNG